MTPGGTAVGRWRFGESLEPLERALREGGLLAIPTESSYGLGVDPGNREAVEAIFRLKGREQTKALPVLIAGRHQLADLGVDRAAPGVATLLDRLEGVWPAPLTVVLPLVETAAAQPVAATSAEGQASLAVRVPDHEPLRELLEALGPLTATSANPSGEAPYLTPEAVEAFLAAGLEERALVPGSGLPAVVVDGGPLAGNPPSTLLALVPPDGGALRVLRRGALDPERVARDLDLPLTAP